MDEGLEARVRREGPKPVIDLIGLIDRSAEDALNRAYDEAAAEGPPGVLLNFSEVSYINSTGIALIVGVMARARKEGIPISAYGLPPHYLEIFQITRLSDFMEIYPDENAALAATTG